MHYEINLDCKPALYLSTYDHTEPGLSFLGTDEPQTMLANSLNWKRHSQIVLAKYLSKSVYKRLSKCSQQCYGDSTSSYNSDSSLFDKVYTRNPSKTVKKPKIYDVTTTSSPGQYSAIIQTSTYSIETPSKHDKVYKKKKSYLSTVTTTATTTTAVYESTETPGQYTERPPKIKTNYVTTEVPVYSTSKYDLFYNKKKSRLATTTMPYASTTIYSTSKKPSKLYTTAESEYTTTTSTYEPNTAVYETTRPSKLYITTTDYDKNKLHHIETTSKYSRLINTTTAYSDVPIAYTSTKAAPPVSKRVSQLYTTIATPPLEYKVAEMVPDKADTVYKSKKSTKQYLNTFAENSLNEEAAANTMADKIGKAYGKKKSTVTMTTTPAAQIDYLITTKPYKKSKSNYVTTTTVTWESEPVFESEEQDYSTTTYSSEARPSLYLTTAPYSSYKRPNKLYTTTVSAYTTTSTPYESDHVYYETSKPSKIYITTTEPDKDYGKKTNTYSFLDKIENTYRHKKSRENYAKIYHKYITLGKSMNETKNTTQADKYSHRTLVHDDEPSYLTKTDYVVKKAHTTSTMSSTTSTTPATTPATTTTTTTTTTATYKAVKKIRKSKGQNKKFKLYCQSIPFARNTKNEFILLRSYCDAIGKKIKND